MRCGGRSGSLLAVGGLGVGVRGRGWVGGGGGVCGEQRGLCGHG